MEYNLKDLFGKKKEKHQRKRDPTASLSSSVLYSAHYPLPWARFL
jgi:hypothetical protein